jgi:hypothetical protein
MRWEMERNGRKEMIKQWWATSARDVSAKDGRVVGVALFSLSVGFIQEQSGNEARVGNESRAKTVRVPPAIRLGMQVFIE